MECKPSAEVKLEGGPNPAMKARRCPQLRMSTSFSQNGCSPKRNWGAFDPGLDPGEEGAQGWGSLRLALLAQGEGPEGHTERSVWLCKRNAEEKAIPLNQ